MTRPRKEEAQIEYWGLAEGISIEAGDPNPCSQCPLLPYKERTEVLPEIVTGGEVCVIGEAPGKVEIKRKRPFVGPAGKILMGLLKEQGLYRGDYSLINAVRCVNPNNPTPPSKALKSCSTYFLNDLRRARAKLVICFGSKAWSQLIGKNQGKIESARGRFLTLNVKERVDANKSGVNRTKPKRKLSRHKNSKGATKTKNIRKDSLVHNGDVGEEGQEVLRQTGSKVRGRLRSYVDATQGRLKEI